MNTPITVVSVIGMFIVCELIYNRIYSHFSERRKIKRYENGVLYTKIEYEKGITLSDIEHKLFNVDDFNEFERGALDAIYMLRKASDKKTKDKGV